MKKFMLCLMAGMLVVFLASSCSAVKRDCQGNKHYKQKGGFYL